jgi:hypothetical protein
MIKALSITLLFVASLATTTFAQIKTPAPSPGAKVWQTVGLTEIEIEYSRPGVKDRTIFAKDGLVPFDKIWRTGANSATKITFSDDVMVDGKELKKGSYAILTMPGATNWAVHFYPYESGSWNSYVEKTPALAVNVKSTKMATKMESFTMGINHITGDAAHLVLAWENTMVAVPIGVEVDKTVMANIETVLAGPSANDYYAAGSYMHDSGKDLNKALMYVQKATKVDEPKFWQVRRESLILADLGKKKEAIAAAKVSLALAKEAKNDDYVTMNEKSIKEWSK